MSDAGISGFVDLHCHLLAGLDDGPSEPEQTLRMAERAIRGGSLAVVATPHSSTQHELSIAERDRRLVEIQASLEGRLEVFCGCEVELSPHGLEPVWRDPSSVTLNRGSYLLIEAPPYGFASNLNLAAPRLRELGLQPILAHPERLSTEDRRAAVSARTGGLLFQVTAGALTGAFGTRVHNAAWDLLENGLVEFVASDGHDCLRRPPDLTAAFHLTFTRFGAATAADLFTWNPLAVLGQPESTASVSATSGSA